KRPALQPPPGTNGFPYCCSPDGRLVAGITDGRATPEGEDTARLVAWEAASGRLVLDVRGRAWDPRLLSFSADSSFLAAAGEDGRLRAWDVRTGKETTAVKLGIGQPRSLVLSRDGRTAGVCSYRPNDPNPAYWDARVIDLGTGKALKELEYSFGDD